MSNWIEARGHTVAAFFNPSLQVVDEAGSFQG